LRRAREELALTIAVDAGDTQNLAGSNRQLDVVYGDVATLVGDAQLAHVERGGGLTRGRTRCVGSRSERAHHQLRQRSRIGVAARHRGHDAAAAHDGDAIGDRHDLVQLVRDEDDRASRRAQALQHPKQLLRFARRQHRGRLVENEDARTPRQCLGNLDTLRVPTGRSPTGVCRSPFPTDFSGERVAAAATWRDSSFSAPGALNTSARFSLTGSASTKANS
jgi:hypothetical protein